MVETTIYRCVTDIRDVREYLDGAKVVAFDFETAPDEAFRNMEKAALDPAMSHICTLSLSVAEHSGIMIPVAHRIGENMNAADILMSWSRRMKRRFVTAVRMRILRCGCTGFSTTGSGNTCRSTA